MYKPEIVAAFIGESIKKTGTPIGIQASELNDWWRGLNFKLNGKRVLFTGFLYQLSPYTAKIASILSRFEDTVVEKAFKLIKFSPSGILKLLKVPEEEKEYYNGIVRRIAQTLLKHKIEFGYRPDLDLYSGILLYELGEEERFAEYASTVGRVLEESGIGEIITIDPHTTYALRILYPEFTDFDLKVTTYIELLDGEFSVEKIEGDARSTAAHRVTRSVTVTIHDPCYYGRYLEISDIPRRILEELGVNVIDVRNSGKLTSCCGGAVESLSPNLSEAMARYRTEELREGMGEKKGEKGMKTNTGCTLVTMCPICLSNFKRVNAPFIDLVELLSGDSNGGR